MTKKIISIFIALAMILTAIPLTISAIEDDDTVYISISDDKQFITDTDGNPMNTVTVIIFTMQTVTVIMNSPHFIFIFMFTK